MATPEEFTGPTTELLQSLIRNQCVNDGTPDSGEETRNSDLLVDYLEGTGLDVERFTPRPGRDSMVARIEGSDPDAPSLCLMGHTDVVPVNPDGWRHDPFAGEVIDGEVWGRGAIDMLNLTSSMAVAFKRLALEGFQPKGDLIYFGVADEEAGGVWGAEWMADNHWDVIDADFVLTELGGWSSVANDGTRAVTVNVGEKGLAWRRLRVRERRATGRCRSVRTTRSSRPPRSCGGSPRTGRRRTSTICGPHRSTPCRCPTTCATALKSPDTIWDTLEGLPVPVARTCHAHTHTTFSPNVVHGGQKTNTIPDTVDIDVDIRTVPGTTREDVDHHLREALGDLYDQVEFSVLQHSDPTRCDFGPGNQLWDVLTTHTQIAYPNAKLIPGLIVGGTDARFYRERGKVAYGAGLFSPEMDFASFGTRFHGNDERIDTASLGLSGNYFYGIAKELLG